MELPARKPVWLPYLVMWLAARATKLERGEADTLASDVRIHRLLKHAFKDILEYSSTFAVSTERSG